MLRNRREFTNLFDIYCKNQCVVNCLFGVSDYARENEWNVAIAMLYSIQIFPSCNNNNRHKKTNNNNITSLHELT